MEEAFKQIKSELGSEAIILQSQKVRAGGLRGLWSPQILEVTAAIDNETVASLALPKRSPVASMAKAPAKAPLATFPPTAEIYTPWSVSRPGLGYEIAPKTAPVPVETDGLVRVPGVAPAQPKPTGDGPTARPSEVDEMRQIVGELRETVRELSLRHPVPQVLNLVPSIATLYRQLIAQGVDDELALELLTTAADELGSSMTDTPKAREAVARNIGRRMSCRGPLRSVEDRGKAVYLIGPTGVGKTTTLAKLAAGLTLVENKRVVLITADTFRIAGTKQLQTYGEILHLPVEVVYSPEELQACQRAHADADFLLIDTPGLSQHNQTQMASLTGFLRALGHRLVYLTVAAGSRSSDLLDTAQNFAVVPLDGLLFTKLDETKQWGPILDLALRTRLPLTYFTSGQNVPEDIEIASAKAVTTRIMGA